MGTFINQYKSHLEHIVIPDFLLKYINVPSIRRLRNIGYFCGMDFASKDIYNFKEKITRFDHSVTTSMIVYNLTYNKKMTLSALFHDVSTPCFSHVIDYMNGDYETQESTEKFTREIALKDKKFLSYLKEDGFDLDEIIDFKRYPIVDNERPKLCADRLDGVILTGSGWLGNVSIQDAYKILDNMKIFINEDDEDEIGFTNYDICARVVEISNQIDVSCHSKEDNFMMQLLADITRLGIEEKLFAYEDLYYLNENDIIRILKMSKNKELINMLFTFENCQKEDIPMIELPSIKKRTLDPLVCGTRFSLI